MSTSSKETKRCEGYILSNGKLKRRWISRITVHQPGKVPKVLAGKQLPDSLVLDTGADPRDVTALELFYGRRPNTQKRPEFPFWPVAACAAVTYVTLRMVVEVIDAAASPFF